MLKKLNTLFFLAVLAVLPGCLPSRIAIDLAPSDGELAESVVIRDGDAKAFSQSNKVALIPVTGIISESPQGGLIRSNSNTVDRVVRQLERAAKDDHVKAIILRIDSPGGTVAASETLALELARFRTETDKPIVISMATVCASGGYYIALAGDEIIAQRSSITGSVGVLIQTINFSEGLRRLGIVAPAVTSDDNKNIASPLEPINDKHYAILQSMVDTFYADFRNRVLEKRGDRISDPDTTLDGRVFTGEQALEAGLVDRLGLLRDAYIRAKELADLEDAVLVRYHRKGATVRTPYSATASA
ncbi:MAG: signal peptide peptidase SppA, partial [Planctomycetota bacterium]